MTRNKIFLLASIFISGSCGLQSKTDTSKIESNADTTEVSNSGQAIKGTKMTSEEYFNEIYKQKKLVKADDKLMESVCDSLLSEGSKESYYFIVFTKAMNGADGFIAEGIGNSAFDFITKSTDKFANHFSSSTELDSLDLNNWADFIFGEIQIAEENREKLAINNLEALLIKNVAQSNKEQRAIIEKLIRRIKTIGHARGVL